MAEGQQLSALDQSLWQWGQALKLAPNVMDEAAGQVSTAVTAAGTVAQGLRAMAQTGASGVPGGQGLVAETTQVADRFSRAAVQAETAMNEMRAAQAEAEALGARFNRDHEADLARLNGERAPRNVEQQADVRAPE